MGASAVRLALVTCPVASAETLAHALVEARVAACVNVLPSVTSTYRWQGEVSRDTEALLLIKTTDAAFDALRREVLAHHPYELPEVIALDVAAGHAPYLEWIAASVGPRDASE
ncbi:MAG: divalent-cation tolerance protein CutA [Panacagrimonas sp.]|jgi:periplasmic divalent cation tolerance protein|nr:divalent-cation tolerance protein CutA [Panacagrimonas sp.]MCC2658973.1 divalent-cation tolerance protein CutA [Panacagrimonas sp.]